MNETAEKPDARWPVMLRALGHRDFRIFFFGQWISLIGTWMQAVAEGWLVYRLTGSAALLGVAGFCAQAPIALLSPLGGLAADRWPRRRVLFATQTAALLLALTLGILTLTGTVRVWMVLTLGALLGAVNAFDIPTRQAFFADMVGREDLINAIALNSAMFNAARVVGPAVAGMLVAVVGEGWCFIINSVSYLAVLGGYFMIRVLGLPKPGAGGHAAFIAEGFRFAWTAKPVRSLLLLLALVCLVGTPYGVLMPIFADAILHGGAGGLGLLMGASGLGALIGALLLTARREIRGLGNWVTVGAAGFGLLIGLFALSKIFWLSALLLIPAGCFIMVQMGATNTLIQTMVPDRLRGRIMAVYAMTFTGAAPAGALLSGVAAEHFGAPLTVLGGGVICIAGALVFMRVLPAMRAPARSLIESAAAETAESGILK